MDCYPQALYAGINPNELEIALSNAMADGGANGGRREGSAGDAARKQQVAVENAILDAVRRRSKNGGNNNDVDPSGMEEGDDLGVMDRVEDLIRSIVGLEHIKC